jgi:HEPN domain-containing protein
VVESWLGRVEQDLRVARLCCEADEPVPDQAAYHVQQAAEKLTKAVLVAHKIRPGKGHKIEEFSPLIPTTFPHRGRFLQLQEFSKYTWAHRYPLEEGREPVAEPSTAEVRDWIVEVEGLKADFKRWLEQAAGGAKRG